MACRPDGYQWGREEGPPLFVVIKLPGVPVEKVKAYLEPETVTEAALPEFGIPERHVPVRRRLWRFRVDDLPLAARNALRDTGELTTNWTAVRNFLRNQKTNQDETRDL